MLDKNTVYRPTLTICVPTKASLYGYPVGYRGQCELGREGKREGKRAFLTTGQFRSSEKMFTEPMLRFGSSFYGNLVHEPSSRVALATFIIC